MTNQEKAIQQADKVGELAFLIDRIAGITQATTWVLAPLEDQDKDINVASTLASTSLDYLAKAQKLANQLVDDAEANASQKDDRPKEERWWKE
ncbi:hypothetical protein [Lactobacillus paragasseri]|jgi:ABC-type transporter Mla subunit MlaD|uniref:Uncharacterized protein n=1 Tax=Lactobacillus paragasseri TaxID=2107999 RepID=A0ABD5A2S7_9LACO|nr:hypothetical protein [Lactobacillus paragasseri]MDK7953360.1 hypothetical protein [Lactobacillus paragasseri]MDO6362207.1 hypothetical protein [Lactobacillus paragasseri]MDX5060542.1 hypothetical protein [Lactobacillus paragasseri]